METLLIQITNNKAHKLLEELENLHIIKVLNKNIGTGQKLSERFAGKLSAKGAEKLQKHIKESRSEWDNS